MTPEKLNEIIWKQDRSFGDYGQALDRKVNSYPQLREAREKFRRFLNKKWSSFMADWLDCWNNHEVIDFRPFHKSLFNYQDAAVLIGMPSRFRVVF